MIVTKCALVCMHWLLHACACIRVQGSGKDCVQDQWAGRDADGAGGWSQGEGHDWTEGAEAAQLSETGSYLRQQISLIAADLLNDLFNLI